MNVVTFLVLVMLMTSVSTVPVLQSDLEERTPHTTAPPNTDHGILQQLGEYFRGRDIPESPLPANTVDESAARDDILHELGEYWKGRLAAMINQAIHQPINLFSHFLGNGK
ncbi:uncharacterized protein LOC133202783 [Saccostrea echinata]|uniref:uncharacterized protein LOC133202783 n=1 Tax=Saccostrea echinata TaxID=191078 RepID=UPI002A7F568B|nr:uncharacterized protein LOC133202783 [Saccostrea echinata]